MARDLKAIYTAAGQLGGIIDHVPAYHADPDPDLHNESRGKSELATPVTNFSGRVNACHRAYANSFRKIIKGKSKQRLTHNT